MSAVKAAAGTVLKRSGTAIAEVVNISGPPLAKDTIEVTHLTSPSNAREHIASWADGGELTFDLNFLPTATTHKALHSEFFTAGVAPVSYSVEWSDGGTPWTFTAFVTGFEPTAERDDKLTASVTLKLTGPVTLPV